MNHHYTLRLVGQLEEGLHTRAIEGHALKILPPKAELAEAPEGSLRLQVLPHICLAKLPTEELIAPAKHNDTASDRSDNRHGNRLRMSIEADSPIYIFPVKIAEQRFSRLRQDVARV